MTKQSPSVLQNVTQFIIEFNSFPFEDFYLFLILRFLVYIYLFIKLSDILLGYQKPTLKTRVLRKFQFVYGEQILRQLDKDDMQELELTISNTILNATKELSASKASNKGSKSNNSDSISVSGRSSQSISHNKNMEQSQRRSLKHDESVQGMGSLIRKSLKLKFDLDKNQYFDPPSASSSILTIISSSQKSEISSTAKDPQIHTSQTQEVEGESEQENLSPKHQTKKTSSQNIQKKPIKATLSQSHQGQQSSFTQKPANIHYPQDELQGMDQQSQQKLIKSEQNLLHLSEDDLNIVSMGHQPNHTSSNEYNSQNGDNIFQPLPSIAKTQITQATDSSYIGELDT